MSSRARWSSSGTDAQPYHWGSADAGLVRGAPDGSRLPLGDSVDDATRSAAIERDAFAKGYAQGERAGAEAANTRAEATVRRLAQTLEELADLRADMIRRTERQIVQLALAIATRVINREISLDRGLLAGMARVALDRLGEHASATIRLHPDDYLAVTAAQTTPWTSEQVHLVADPQVSRGGCLVQSDFGFIDASGDGQIHELARVLLEDTDDARSVPAVHAHSHALNVK